MSIRSLGKVRWDIDSGIITLIEDMQVMVLKEFLTSGGELSKEIEYTADDDNVLVMYQGKSKITLTYRQIVDVKEFMDAYIDTVDYATMKRINDEK